MGQPFTSPVGVSKSPSQILRLQPVVAAVYGGGATSAVVFRGNESGLGGAVRVTPDAVTTAGVAPSAAGWTCFTEPEARRPRWRVPPSRPAATDAPSLGIVGDDVLETVFEDGELLRDWTFDED